MVPSALSPQGRSAAHTTHNGVTCSGKRVGHCRYPLCGGFHSFGWCRSTSEAPVSLSAAGDGACDPAGARVGRRVRARRRLRRASSPRPHSIGTRASDAPASTRRTHSGADLDSGRRKSFSPRSRRCHNPRTATLSGSIGGARRVPPAPPRARRLLSLATTEDHAVSPRVSGFSLRCTTWPTGGGQLHGCNSTLRDITAPPRWRPRGPLTATEQCSPARRRHERTGGPDGPTGATVRG